MMKPNVLILADPADKIHLKGEDESDTWNIFWHTLPFNNLYTDIGEIKRLIRHYDIDFVHYSRNDQVANRVNFGPLTREMKIGYSSFSGIDRNYRIEQMKKCFEDFILCNNRDTVVLPGDERNEWLSSPSAPSFSLVFDTEQLGGVRYGLPRVLDLLRRYGIRATFFVTNLMHMVYPTYIDAIHGYGHEIGLHGIWHEYLSLYDNERQRDMISEMIRGFKIPVTGANFIGRMNNTTIDALIENNIQYFVYPLINYYERLGYPKFPTHPYSVSRDSGSIVMVPISVETYNQPWFSIKAMIDSALRVCGTYNRHITILCHPFRDGNIQHLKVTEKMVHYLVASLGLNAVPLKDAPLSNCMPLDAKTAEIDRLISAPYTVAPLNKQDLLDILPQNLVRVARCINRNRTVW